MKKFISLALTALAGLTLAACSSTTTDSTSSSSSSSSTETQTIKVASVTAPSLTIMEMLVDNMEKRGFKMEVIQMNDNTQPNIALNSKEIDANFFQHSLYMENFNAKNNGTLVSIQPTYHSRAALWSKTLKSLDDLKDGASLVIPSDPANMHRALLLLNSIGLITVKDPSSKALTLEDISDNPKNLQIETVELLQLNSAYEEKDLVFNYPGYVAKIGLTPDDALQFESEYDVRYALTLVAREDNKDSAAIKALQEELLSDEVRDFIENERKGYELIAY